MSKLTIIVSELSEPELTTESYLSPLSSLTCVSSSSPVVLNSTEDLLTWLQQDSLASHSAMPENEREQSTSETCGRPPSNAYAWYDQSTHCWRTYQGCLLVDILEPFSATWPRQGMTLDGVYYPRPNAVRHTNEIGYGYVPTPRANEHGNYQYDRGNHDKPRPTLTGWVKMFPTPTAIDAGTGRINRSASPNAAERPTLAMMAKKDSWPTPTTRDWRSGKGAQKREGHAQPLTDVIGGQLNPEWVELLMGFPLGWTSLNHISMIQYCKWLMGFRGDNYEEEGSAREVLRELRQEVGAETLQRKAGRFEYVQAPEVLRSELCRNTQGIDEARLQLEGAQASKDELRSVRLQPKTTSSPHRPGQPEQSAGEHTDAMQALPRLLAHYGKEAWENGSWENATPRTAKGVTFRTDRLKAIGNGQVPAVAAAAWHFLSEGIV